MLLCLVHVDFDNRKEKEKKKLMLQTTEVIFSFKYYIKSLCFVLLKFNFVSTCWEFETFKEYKERRCRQPSCNYLSGLFFLFF